MGEAMTTTKGRTRLYASLNHRVAACRARKERQRLQARLQELDARIKNETAATVSLLKTLPPVENWTALRQWTERLHQHVQAADRWTEERNRTANALRTSTDPASYLLPRSSADQA